MASESFCGSFKRECATLEAIFHSTFHEAVQPSLSMTSTMLRKPGAVRLGVASYLPFCDVSIVSHGVQELMHKLKRERETPPSHAPLSPSTRLNIPAFLRRQRSSDTCRDLLVAHPQLPTRSRTLNRLTPEE